MRAKKYNIEVFEGVMDWIHDGGQSITEYFVPELKLYVNQKAIFTGEESERVSKEFEWVELEVDTIGDLRALAPLLEAEKMLQKRIKVALELEKPDEIL